MTKGQTCKGERVWKKMRKIDEESHHFTGMMKKRLEVHGKKENIGTMD